MTGPELEASNFISKWLYLDTRTPLRPHHWDKPIKLDDRREWVSEMERELVKLLQAPRVEVVIPDASLTA